MVYVLDADCCASGSAEARNKIFTAITRAKGWVRICGVGKDMDVIAEEINACKENDYKLAFTIPPKIELENIKRINRDAQQDYNALKLTEEQKEYLTALIDGGNPVAIEAFIRKISSSKERRRRN